MIKCELLKLTPEERDVIFLWRILCREQLSVEKILEISTHTDFFVKNTIAKFNKNVRLKLEVYNLNKEIEKTIEEILCE